MKTFLLFAFASIQTLSAVTIKIDYTYDTTNFFNTQAKKDAMEAVAKFYGNILQDTLLRIDAADFPSASWTANFPHPATGANVGISNLAVPANTIIVYVGARDLPGTVAGQGGPGGFNASGFSEWFARIRGRGNAGAESSTASARTDFAPWGGAITFDSPSTWNFSLSQNVSGSDFLPIALHELGHLLGVGTADSWFNKASGGVFTGSACARSFGSAPGLQSGDGHFGGSVSNSKAFGSFGVAHGASRQVLMLPILSDNNSTVIVASDLDLAALVDIGWDVRPPQVLSYSSLSPAGAAFSWNSSSFYDYKVQRSSDLASFPNGSPTGAGTGLVQTWTDPSPPSAKAFYRLAATHIFSAPSGTAAPAALPASGGAFGEASEHPRIVTGCYGH